MSLKPTWAVPEPGFDETKNEHVLKMYKTLADGSRPAMVQQTQTAASLEARIEEKLQDFTHQIGRAPTEEEKKWITQVETRCSGWLEGLRVDLQGKTTVPVSHLNRLEDQQEKVILYFSRELMDLKAANARDSRGFNHGNLSGNADGSKDSAKELQKQVDQLKLQLQDMDSQLENLKGGQPKAL
ncbi:hypothetical protein PFICI_13120 [Pestalotiopsis fici W106-1]|uniref:Uncharacterized protein n=1 Tax=Pestalotiopsis fici (strain W106-1 / CGMCC3.15140) TaxID=1229662 RepID=W3WP97_PESFW|nr:uncharacterized protein PFICI_13120 [Pestalotiopsis fici W106-1]ETS74636.1 hypothetical protein PFICI_13120 [Pestalotiopsis fici W106-1]